MAAIEGIPHTLAAMMVLDLVGVPGAMLGKAGQLIALNRRLEKLIPDVIRDSVERLQLANVVADELLRDALSKLGYQENRECSIPIPSAGNWPLVIVHLFAFDGSVSEAFERAHALLALTIVTRRETPAIPMIQSLFNMTPAEARIAQAVAQGQTVGAIGTRVGLSRRTLRSQIRAGEVNGKDVPADIGGMQAARLHAIKADIAANISRRDLTLDTVAARPNISPSYIRKLLETDGTNFTEFVLERRLLQARRLLRDPSYANHRISGIALATGFGDISYFNRTFRRRFGYAPSEARVGKLRKPDRH